jgi:hypothetical protein
MKTPAPVGSSSTLAQAAKASCVCSIAPRLAWLID